MDHDADHDEFAVLEPHALLDVTGGRVSHGPQQLDPQLLQMLQQIAQSVQQLGTSAAQTTSSDAQGTMQMMQKLMQARTGQT